MNQQTSSDALHIRIMYKKYVLFGNGFDKYM